jgi:hypothetical protein
MDTRIRLFKAFQCDDWVRVVESVEKQITRVVV